MGAHPIQVSLPEKLVAEIDALVGRDGRSDFVAKTAEAEIRRLRPSPVEAEERKRRLLALLQEDAPVWKDEVHPELADGAYAWVKKLRKESDKRIPDDEVSGAER